MNAVEIEEAVSALAELPFEAEEFPFAFLQAFGNKADDDQATALGRVERFRPRRGAPAQQHPYQGLP